jgi:hypothetical protein
VHRTTLLAFTIQNYAVKCQGFDVPLDILTDYPLLHTTKLKCTEKTCQLTNAIYFLDKAA